MLNLAPADSRPAGSTALRLRAAAQGLRYVPEPRPRFPQTRSFTSVLESVRAGLRDSDRLIIVTGGSGTGKTQLCRALIEDAELLTFTSVMLHPPTTPEDLLTQFLRDVEVIDRGTSDALRTRNNLVFTLQRYLESLIPLGARAVLVIDEAQHLPPVVLEQLRLLLNFETADAPLLQVVLVGQPELHTLLRWPELRSVALRVSRQCELVGITPEESSEFLEECLAQRGAAGMVRLAPAAERMLMTASQGVPRVVDRMCQHALEIASAQHGRRIEPSMVAAAARRIGVDAPYATDRRRRMRLAAAGATVALAAAVAGVGAWTWMRHPSMTTPSAPAQALVAPVTQTAALAPPAAVPPPTPVNTAPVAAAAPATPLFAGAPTDSHGNVYIVLSPTPVAAPVPSIPARRTTTAAAAVAKPASPAARSPEEAYRDAVKPSLQKLRELGPFMMSAASSPDPRVASAVIAGIGSVRSALEALPPPPSARGSYVTVLGAVDSLSSALSPGFTGDRPAAIRQAMSTIDVVGGVLVSGN
ncbi:MAG TPA: ATP-binding protein [Vicinamibacterales bacterium]|nr:ATP-binding protein [Vicinamibacterales bacterium]